ncbi:MAG: glycoside hydrolase family 3 N-terminal domain-containing protein [Oenococcus sp.]|uniref:glycoside hydrolase family 3 protein n=1 Tax=Oenococcus sp. TaxID=1979414 RepID=UPI0039EB5FD0
MINLTAKPFNLDASGINWVKATLAGMTLQEKIGQLFCLLGDFKNTSEIDRVLNKYSPGGIMYRPGDSHEIQNMHRYLQEKSTIPLLLGANLESGGDGIGNDGTFYGRQIQVAATGDTKYAYRLGDIAGSEGAAVGCNWAFAPVVDINFNFENPITNVRTYGSDPKLVKQMASAYIKGCQQHDVAVAIKHFPGDGIDDRDQHLVTTSNSLSTQEWDETYGDIYRTLIDEGAKTVMVGHIKQPAYTRFFNPSIKDEDIMPGSLSPELLQSLLRDKLGFNGLISSDATNMAGFASCGKRSDLLPMAIAAGCDMVLFTRDLEEDYGFMLDGFKNGVITEERLNDAVTRILATKASLKLPNKQVANTLVPPASALSILKSKEHQKWARELSEESITLVKDTQKLLPLSSNKFKKILVIVLGDVLSASGKPPVADLFISSLKNEGFYVDEFDSSVQGEMLSKGSIREIKNSYDLICYFANIKTASNQTNVRINWLPPMGVDMPWFVNEIPTLFVSIANPYHLQDVPMIKTYINAYTANEFNPEIIVEKLVGKSGFKGKNPIDPFCHYWDSTF